MSIDRKGLVRRHNPKLSKVDSLSPFTVGNGEFCFTADVTGLQSFPEAYLSGIPLCTMSNWGWHSFPTRQAASGEALRLTGYDTYGRTVYYPVHADGQKALYDCLRQNPHRFHLGQLGFCIRSGSGRSHEASSGSDHAGEVRSDDSERMSIDDIRGIDQKLDLWTGILHSGFEVDGKRVSVKTCCHPNRDAIGVHVESGLLADGRVSVELRFPYPSERMAAANWNKPERHTTRLAYRSRTHALIVRVIDDTTYFATLHYPEDTWVRQVDDHSLMITPKGQVAALELTCCFDKTYPRECPSSYESVETASEQYWSEFWNDGGAIELSESSHPEALELERRVVLSQYLTAIQCSGSLPPQETGLTCNSWYGKFHLEMHWWHAAHFALWDRAHMLERSLWWYQSILPKARALAAEQEYKGARWPKMVGPDGAQSPSPIAPLLIWQQPHPIFLAELCYRARTHFDPNSRSSLDRNRDLSFLEIYKDIVFESAEFMVSFAYYDSLRDRYVLGPPVIPVQENHAPEITINPTFEIQYFKYGLRIAQRWRERLGLSRSPRWDDVISKLSGLPARDGVYLAHEDCPDTFESFNYDHPSMLYALGVLPDDSSVDHDIMRRTLLRVIEDWQWERAWGWDFPACAMTAARLGEPEIAIDLLMYDCVKNRYLNNGHVWQRPNLPLYLPANGGLLTAIAMMAAGWDRRRHPRERDCAESQSGGMRAGTAIRFPDSGKWRVISERILPYV